MPESNSELALKLGALDEKHTALFVCDIQEKFQDVMLNFDAVVSNSKKLIDGCTILELPIIVTEQYPKGLGKTVDKLKLGDNVTLKSEKTQFDMMTSEVEQSITTICGGSLKSVILCGIESHVCVEQTAIALLARGLQVHVIADCVSSRTLCDRNLALKRMAQIGCFVSTVETVLFKLIKGKEHKKFKEISMLVKQPSMDTGISSSL